jgi:hypothetical protein
VRFVDEGNVMIEGEQGNKKYKERNDRIVAIEEDATVGKTSKQLTSQANNLYANSKNSS